MSEETLEPDEKLDPENVVWHREQSIVTVMGPCGKLKLKAGSLSEARRMYCKIHNLDPSDESIAISERS